MTEDYTVRSYTLQQAHIDIIKAHANANYDGNESMALRRIINEWKQFKGAQLPMPLPLQEAAK
jgi:hypothetical protein